MLVVGYVAGWNSFGIKFCLKINDIGKFVLLILIIEMRFFGTLLSCFSLVFFFFLK